MNERSVDIKDLITKRGLTYESLLETLKHSDMTLEQQREVEARYLYILTQAERHQEIAKYLRRNYGEHTDLQIIADLVEANPAQEKILTLNQGQGAEMRFVRTTMKKLKRDTASQQAQSGIRFVRPLRDSI